MHLSYIHPLWRRVIFPFFGSSEIITLIFFTAIVVITLYLVGKTTIMPLAVAGGYIGAVILSNDLAPAVLEISCNHREYVEQTLKEIGYSNTDRGWIMDNNFFPVSNDYVRFNDLGEALSITGPYKILRFIESTGNQES